MSISRLRSLLYAAVLLLVVVGTNACGTGDDSSTASNTATQKKASDKDVQSTLRNAAMAEEVHYTEEQSYTKNIADLEKQDFKEIEGVEVTIVRAGPFDYCVEAKGESGTVWNYDSKEGSVIQGRCI